MGNYYGNNSKDKNILNIYITGESKNFNLQLIPNNSTYKWITQFSEKKITDEILSAINNDIKLKYQRSIECNCILIFLPKQNINIINNFFIIT